MKKRETPPGCDSCGNYVLDEEYGGYLCEAPFDEDEMAAFAGGFRFSCPYYQPDDEYRIVRKQM